MKYTGRFQVKFKVQSRMIRVYHPDFRYVASMFKYLKNFCCLHKDITFCCLDDKAMVPVGDPGVLISTGVQPHNKALAPTDTSLIAADHDFSKLSGVIPSVGLVCREIPKKMLYACCRVYTDCSRKLF